jgi:hypothetical protein
MDENQNSPKSRRFGHCQLGPQMLALRFQPEQRELRKMRGMERPSY